MSAPTMVVTTDRTTGPRPWSAAWRRHRAVVIPSLAVIFVLIGLVFWQHAVLPSCSMVWRDDGTTDCQALFDTTRWMPMLATALTWAPFVLGGVVGITVFARDIEMRTHILALTQGIGRARWWLVNTVVAGGPLLLSFLTLGIVFGLAVRSRQPQWTWVLGEPVLEWPLFDLTWAMPACWFLVTFAAASTAGLVLRSTIGGLVVAAVLVVLVALGSLAVRLDLVPHTSQDRPLGKVFSFGVELEPGSSYVRQFAVDAREVLVEYPAVCPEVDELSREFGGDITEDQNDQLNQAYMACWQDAGAVAMRTESVSPSQWSRLQWTLSGLLVLLAAGLLGLGARRIRHQDLS